jgi:hypothetical protein
VQEVHSVFDAEQASFLESGCSLILGTVLPDGEPHAGRGWGLNLLPVTGQVRLLLDAEDSATVARAAAGGAVAITAANVRTLRSMQLKGRVLSVEAASSDDVDRAARFCEDFFTDVADTDGVGRDLTERLVPAGYVACTVAVDHVFDQTPGPGAGAQLSGPTP